MNPERYSRLSELFVQVCDLPAGDRQPRIVELCAGDELLERDLQRLLAAHDSAQMEAGDGLAGDPISEMECPSEIGGYAILGVLGTGGMSVVYRARQTNPARDVALKVLHSNLASTALRRRFQQEAELLARLQHPGIAAVYEAGEWAGEGRRRPFLVMELVNGATLTDHARQHGLDVRQRLELIADIADAVAHAHTRGVIHRDLKPANILVDESGRPKVLDFGVARVIDSDIRVTTQQTDVGQLIGTIAYMSPEQASGDPRAIDHRSDVYALGVVMHELLGGELPLNLNHRTLPDAVRAIRDDDPARLSAINRMFRGDLETIVAKSMEKEPQRRYQSAAELAADIRRYLRHEPISARPPTPLYQLGKFSRRHKGLVAGLATAMVMLVAGLVVSLVFAMRAERRSRELAVSVQRLQAANRFFSEMLEAAHPEINRLNLATPSDVRVVDVLDFAAANLASAYADQPEVEVALRSTLAETYLQIEQNDKGRKQLDQAWRLAQGTLGDDHPDTIRLAIRVATVADSHVEAESMLRELLARSERVNGRDHADTIACLNGLTGSLFYQNRYADALPLAEDATSRAQRSLDPTHEELQNARNNLAFTLLNLHRAAKAEPLFRAVLDSCLEQHGSQHPATLRAQRNMVAALRDLRRSDDAVSMMRQVVDSQTTMYGEASPTTLFSLNQLSVLLAEAGDRPAAIESLQRIVDAYRSIGEVDSDPALMAARNMASMLLAEGELDRAETALSAVLDSWLAGHDVESTHSAQARYILGKVSAARGQHELALARFEHALATAMREAGGDHQLTVNVRTDCAKSLIALNRFEEALTMQMAAYESVRKARGESHQASRTRAEDIAGLLDRIGRANDAATWRARAAPADAATQP